MNWNRLYGRNGLKWTEMDSMDWIDRIDWYNPNWIEWTSEPNGLKCDAGMAQQEHSKNKIYATVYGYYINIYFHRCIMHFLKMAHMMIIEVMIRYLYIKAFFFFFAINIGWYFIIFRFWIGFYLPLQSMSWTISSTAFFFWVNNFFHC